MAIKESGIKPPSFFLTSSLSESLSEYLQLRIKIKKALWLVVSLVAIYLLIAILTAKDGQARLGPEEAMNRIADAYYKHYKTYEPLRKTSFNVDDWPNEATRFTKVEKGRVPILAKPDLTSSVYGLTQYGEIFQLLDEHKVEAGLFDPLGIVPDSSGIWHKVRLLDGKEGWILAIPDNYKGPPLASFFEVKKYIENITGSTFYKRKIWRAITPATFNFRAGHSLSLKRGDFLMVSEESQDWITLEGFNGYRATFDKKGVISAGKVETINWNKNWDIILQRKGPPILFILCAIVIVALVSLTIFNHPGYREKEIRVAVPLIYFALLIIHAIISSYLFSSGSNLSLKTNLDYRRYDLTLLKIGLLLVLPYLIVMVFFFEGFITFLIRIKYLFLTKSVKEVLMERTQKKEDKARENKYKTKKKEIEEKERVVQEKLSALRQNLPEVVDALPRDIVDYQGYFREVEKRFQERQLTKTTKLARERLEEVRRLCEEGAKLQRAMVDLEVAKFEFANVDKAVEFKKKEMTLKDKTLDRDILQAEADISNLKRLFSRRKKREDFGL